MNSRQKRTGSLAILFALFTAVVYAPVGLAQSGPQVTAILTTGNNQPINVNGASAISGATVVSGASIETTDQVGGSLSLPNHFTLDISPRSSVVVTFDQNGIKVNLIKGCVVLHTKRGTTGEIDTARGAVKADGTKDDRLEVCDPSIATAPAAAAGGLTTGEKIAIIGAIVGALALIPILKGGSNPSPGAP
ncbi:MAG TPA: hypothetical protein VLL54_09605 [Pyrinomonadaceae bacterium]|nr:hypothetical protein [Pyrinomonadaceae bacterium]